MAERPHALLVSWLFPPHNSIGSKRAYRFARNLPSLGWDATVLCGREPPARFRDPTPWSVPQGVTVEADYDAAWVTDLANRADAKAHSAPTKAPTDPSKPSLLARLAGRPVSLGDALPTETIAVHLPHARAAARRIASARRVDVVWTTSYPYSAHLVGVALAREFGIPFVADLRDPWTLNFVHEQKLPFARAAERALERYVFRHAARIVVTTDTLADAYRALYPEFAERFVTIRNGFEPLDLPARDVPASPVRVVHFGHVYSERTLEPVLRAMARALGREGTRRDVVLENLGRLSDRDRALVRELGLDALVIARDPMPYGVGMRSLRNAHGLLLAAWGTQRGPLLLPGKLYDYLLAGAPILAVGENPELARILAHTRTGTIVSDDASLDAAWSALLDGTLPFDPDARAIADYSAPEAAKKLVTVFEEVRR